MKLIETVAVVFGAAFVAGAVYEWRFGVRINAVLLAAAAVVILALPSAV